MKIEAEVIALDGGLTATQAAFLMLVRQLSESGVLDRKKLADELTEQAETEFKRMKMNPREADDRTHVAAQELKMLARRIQLLPENHFRPTVVASRNDEPEPR
jgi:hypothetical protein